MKRMCLNRRELNEMSDNDEQKGKSVSFQLYPDKALAGTDHLTPPAFKAYWKTLWWMWLHSPNQYSIPDTTPAWHTATGFEGELLETVRAEIMQEHMPMLQRVKAKAKGTGKTPDILVSGGLKKEAAKQGKRREQQVDAANRRWETERNIAEAERIEQNLENSKAFAKTHPHYAKVLKCVHLRSITPEDYLKMIRSFPNADEARAVKQAVDKADFMTGGITHPPLFLRKQFSMDESGQGRERKSTLPASRKKGTDKKGNGKNKRTPF